MYIADAYLGLMRVGRRGGLAEVVATEAAGVPFNFLNGVDVDQETGDVYFTDSSTAYQRRYVLLWHYARYNQIYRCSARNKHACGRT
jgi:sugar lactone lactonase YvrE